MEHTKYTYNIYKAVLYNCISRKIISAHHVHRWVSGHVVDATDLITVFAQTWNAGSGSFVIDILKHH